MPASRRATKGKSIMNFISLSADEKVTSILPLPKTQKNAPVFLMLVTKEGTAKKMSGESFKDVRRSGIIAIRLDAGDQLISALLTEKGKDVTLANLKGVLEHYFTEFLEKKTEVRLRSSFFPFTEPSVEVDMQCFKCNGTGKLVEDAKCNVCSSSGWIEIMGAGMVHPKVLENAGLNPRIYQGFAFGGGLDRLIMLKTGIDDIRMLYNGDLRLVNQF
jgi:hypothetical protein